MEKQATEKKTQKKPEVNRVNCYTKKEFEALANAVNSGLPVNDAEEIIQREKKLGATGEQYFWARINLDSDSSIRIKRKTINKLKNLKEANYETGMDLIINKLIDGNTTTKQILKDTEKNNYKGIKNE